MVIKLEKDDYKKWTQFRMGEKSVISRKEFEMVCDLYRTYYKNNLPNPCTCNPKQINQWIADLNKIWENGN